MPFVKHFQGTHERNRDQAPADSPPIRRWSALRTQRHARWSQISDPLNPQLLDDIRMVAQAPDRAAVTTPTRKSARHQGTVWRGADTKERILIEAEADGPLFPTKHDRRRRSRRRHQRRLPQQVRQRTDPGGEPVGHDRHPHGEPSKKSCAWRYESTAYCSAMRRAATIPLSTPPIGSRIKTWPT